MKVQAGKMPGQYTCDKKKCPAFAGYSICSHVLAVAIQNDECGDLLKQSQHNSEARLHDLSMIGMPSNAGRKPGHCKRKGKKRSTSQDENSVPTNIKKRTLPKDPSTPEPDALSPDIPIPPVLSISSPSQVPSPLSCANSFLPSEVHLLPPPPPLIPASHAMTQLLPMSHIQINQQPTHCSHTSMNITHPSMTNTLPFSSNPLPSVNQENNFWFQNLQSNTQQQERLPSNPFFVKFLTKQIRICQGCRSGYKRNEIGEPPNDLIVGHLERQTYNDQVTGIARLSRETCVHYHASP